MAKLNIWKYESFLSKHDTGNMTEEQKRQYNELSPNGKAEYLKSMERHPDWSHNQHMAKVSIMEQADATIGGGGKDVNPSDPKLWKIILEKASSFLHTIGALTKEIKQKFDHALDAIKTLIFMGVKKIGGIITSIFG